MSQFLLIPIRAERNVPKHLAAHAREFCGKIGAVEIANIAVLGDGDYRAMYFIQEGEKRKMLAAILKVPKII